MPWIVTLRNMTWYSTLLIFSQIYTVQRTTAIVGQNVNIDTSFLNGTRTHFRSFQTWQWMFGPINNVKIQLVDRFSVLLLPPVQIYYGKTREQTLTAMCIITKFQRLLHRRGNSSMPKLPHAMRWRQLRLSLHRTHRKPSLVVYIYFIFICIIMIYTYDSLTLECNRRGLAPRCFGDEVKLNFVTKFQSIFVKIPRNTPSSYPSLQPVWPVQLSLT